MSHCGVNTRRPPIIYRQYNLPRDRRTLMSCMTRPEAKLPTQITALPRDCGQLLAEQRWRLARADVIAQRGEQLGEICRHRALQAQALARARMIECQARGVQGLALESS